MTYEEIEKALISGGLTEKEAMFEADFLCSDGEPVTIEDVNAVLEEHRESQKQKRD